MPPAIPIVAIASITVLALWLALNFIWSRRLAHLIESRRAPAPADANCPRPLVVLSLRGADPFLDDCLAGLLSQDYPDYELRIIVDSRSDPAWERVQRVVAAHPARNVVVEPLTRRRRTCGLKNSALVQAAAGLDESFGAFVIVDADVVPRQTWLRDLIAPLRDPQVGAASGLRWFRPVRNNPGNLIRYVWNAAAVLQMVRFGIGWGGSLAIRADVFRQAHLAEKWSRSLFDDTFAADELARLGYRLEFVPAATAINRESVDLPDCLRFVSRQLLDVRLYHHSWKTIAWIGLMAAAALIVVCALGIAAAVSHCWGAALVMTTGLAGCVVGLAAVVMATQRSVERAVPQSSEQRLPASFGWRLLWAVPLTMLAYSACLIAAIWMRRIRWRGVGYELTRGRRVRLVDYSPYRDPAIDSRTRLSL